MRLDLSWLGWIHTVPCLIAIPLGAVLLLRRKATATHRALGQIYLPLLAFLSATSLGIYRSHRFFFPHWFAIATLIFVAIAWIAARWHRPRRFWLPIHVTATVLSYWSLLGGGVNEVWLRVDALHAIAQRTRGIPIGVTHTALWTATVAVLVYYLVKVSRRRWRVFARARAAAGTVPA